MLSNKDKIYSKTNYDNKNNNNDKDGFIVISI